MLSGVMDALTLPRSPACGPSLCGHVRGVGSRLSRITVASVALLIDAKGERHTMAFENLRMAPD
jgi:hypothetical protein